MAAIALAALVAGCGGGDDGGGEETVSGEVAEGPPLANVVVNFSCVNGNRSTTTDAKGSYQISLPANGGCLAKTTTPAGLTIYSVESGSDAIVNVTPLTALVIEFLAGQCNVSSQDIVGDYTGSAPYRSLLNNGPAVKRASSAVYFTLQQSYGFVVGNYQAVNDAFTSAMDSDLERMMAAGLLTSSGAPVPGLVNSIWNSGRKTGNCPGAPSTGGTGGTT